MKKFSTIAGSLIIGVLLTSGLLTYVRADSSPLISIDFEDEPAPFVSPLPDGGGSQLFICQNQDPFAQSAGVYFSGQICAAHFMGDDGNFFYDQASVTAVQGVYGLMGNNVFPPAGKIIFDTTANPDLLHVSEISFTASAFFRNRVTGDADYGFITATAIGGNSVTIPAANVTRITLTANPGDSIRGVSIDITAPSADQDNPIGVLTMDNVDVVTGPIAFKTVRQAQNQCRNAGLADRLGNSTKTISDRGCALSTLTDAINFAQNSNFTPCSFNDFLVQTPSGKGFPFKESGDIIWQYATTIGTSHLYRFVLFSGGTSNANTLKNLMLENQAPVVVGVNVKDRGPGHWVLVNGMTQDGRFTIDDPATNASVGGPRATTLDQYPGPFVIKGQVRPTGSSHLSKSLSETCSDGQGNLLILSDDPAEFLVTDMSTGKRVGFDSISNQTVSELSNAAYFVDRLDGDETGDEGLPSYSAYIPCANFNALRIDTIGKKAGTYSLTVSVLDDSDSVISSSSVSGSTSLGAVVSFPVTNGTIVGTSPSPSPSPSPTPSPEPSPSPSPEPSGLVTLESDKAQYSPGESAVVTATISSSYVQPQYSQVLIYASTNGGVETPMTPVGPKNYVENTESLSNGNSVVVARTVLMEEPKELWTLNQEIARANNELEHADFFGKIGAYIKLIGLSIARLAVSVFEHASTQVLSVDRLTLTVLGAN